MFKVCQRAKDCSPLVVVIATVAVRGWIYLGEKSLHQAPAKRSQHANMPTQHVACVWPPYCDMLGVVGSSLKTVKFEPTTPNTSQHGGQTYATCCAQQGCDMLSWHVAIVWPGLYRCEFCFTWERRIKGL